MDKFDRGASLPEVMQGHWVDVDDPSSELVVTSGEVTCFGKVVDYDFNEVGEDDGAITVSLRVRDDAKEDDFQRANITELVWTPEGELHAYNTQFASQFIRPAA